MIRQLIFSFQFLLAGIIPVTAQISNLPTFTDTIQHNFSGPCENMAQTADGKRVYISFTGNEMLLIDSSGNFRHASQYSISPVFGTTSISNSLFTLSNSNSIRLVSFYDSLNNVSLVQFRHDTTAGLITAWQYLHDDVKTFPSITGNYYVAACDNSDTLRISLADNNDSILWGKTFYTNLTSSIELLDGRQNPVNGNITLVASVFGPGYPIIMQFDANGNLLWAKQYNNMLTSGAFEGMFMLSDGAVVLHKSSPDVSLLCINADGSIRWHSDYSYCSFNTMNRNSVLEGTGGHLFAFVSSHCFNSGISHQFRIEINQNNGQAIAAVELPHYSLSGDYPQYGPGQRYVMKYGLSVLVKATDIGDGFCSMVAESVTATPIGFPMPASLSFQLLSPSPVRHRPASFTSVPLSGNMSSQRFCGNVQTAAESISPAETKTFLNNPAKDRIEIQLTGNFTAKNKIIRLSDCSGRIIRTVVFSGNEISVPCADLENGIYLLELVGDGERKMVRKILINN